MSDDAPMLRGRARTLFRTAAFGGYSAAALAAFELHHRRVAPEAVATLRARYKRKVGSDLLALLGVDWRIENEGAPGEERIDVDDRRPRLVVSNHRTALDIGVLLAHFAGSMLSRAEVARWPVLGRLATHGQTIFVDRSDKASGARAIRQIRAALMAGRTVVAFPEGTTLAGDEVRPFQGGAFAATRGLDVEVVPVGLAYDRGVEWVGGATFLEHVSALAARDGTRVVGVVGRPFRAEGSASSLAVRARDDVDALVRGARARFDERYGG
jgi:lyso-ornithine lipid O-acyltransferase